MQPKTTITTKKKYMQDLEEKIQTIQKIVIEKKEEKNRLKFVF